MHRFTNGSMAVPRFFRARALDLSAEHTVEPRSRRMTKAMSLSSTTCETAKVLWVSMMGMGRFSSGTIFWIMWGWFTYDVWLERYPGSPYAYASMSPSSVLL